MNIKNKITDEEKKLIEEFDKGYQRYGNDIEFDDRIKEMIDQIIPDKDVHVARKIFILATRILKNE